MAGNTLTAVSHSWRVAQPFQHWLVFKFGALSTKSFLDKQNKHIQDSELRDGLKFPHALKKNQHLYYD